MQFGLINDDKGRPSHRVWLRCPMQRWRATLSALRFKLKGNGNAAELDDSKVSARLRRLSRVEFPATVAVARFFPVPLDEEFAFGMKLVVAGLEMLLAIADRLTA